MKKLLCVFSLFFISSVSHAGVFDTLRGDTGWIKYDLAVAADVSTHTVLIDISSTTVWPHSIDGYVLISKLRISIDKAAASTETVKVGVVNFVNASTGSVSWFYESPSETEVSNGKVLDEINFEDGELLRTKIKPAVNLSSWKGTPVFFLTNDETTNSTIYQTDVNLPSPNSIGYTSPGFQDIVMNVSNGTGAISLSVYIEYLTVKN